jgi:uncharacterized membrane protein required for colicin V production
MGLWMGLVKSFFRIAAIISAIFITLQATGVVASLILGWFPSFHSTITGICTGVFIFVLTLAVFQIIAAFVHDKVKDSALNSINRLLGGIFGLAKSAGLLWIAFSLLTLLPPFEMVEKHRNTSLLYRYFASLDFRFTDFLIDETRNNPFENLPEDSESQQAKKTQNIFL